MKPRDVGIVAEAQGAIGAASDGERARHPLKRVGVECTGGAHENCSLPQHLNEHGLFGAHPHTVARPLRLQEERRKNSGQGSGASRGDSVVDKGE